MDMMNMEQNTSVAETAFSPPFPQQIHVQNKFGYMGSDAFAGWNLKCLEYLHWVR